MKLFGLGAAAALTLGAATQALVGQATVSAEQAEAANTELGAAGITGVQFITKAAFEELDGKATRLDQAEASVQGYVTALTAAGAADVAALVAQRDGYKLKADKFDALPGASHTTPALPTGTSDVEKAEPNADQLALDALPHNKALAGHPIFG